MLPSAEQWRYIFLALIKLCDIHPSKQISDVVFMYYISISFYYDVMQHKMVTGVTVLIASVINAIYSISPINI